MSRQDWRHRMLFLKVSLRIIGLSTAHSPGTYAVIALTGTTAGLPVGVGLAERGAVGAKVSGAGVNWLQRLACCGAVCYLNVPQMGSPETDRGMPAV